MATPIKTRLKRSDGYLHVRNFVCLNEAPSDTLYFSRYMPRFMGLEKDKANPDLIWGITGTDSMGRCAHYASMDARATGGMTYQLDLYYKIDDLPTSNAVLDSEASTRTGYLNLTRLTAEFSEILRKRFLQCLAHDEDPEYERFLDMRLEDLVKWRPMVVHDFMTYNPSIKAFVHPVFISKDVTVKICVMRNEPARIGGVEVRYHDDIVGKV